MEETVQQPEQMDKDEASSTGSPERIEAPVSQDLDIEEPFYGFDEIPQRRRSTRTSKPTEKMKQFKGIHEALIEESWKEITASQKVPKCYQEAIVSEDVEKWETAIREEYSSLMENGTWELTPLPEGRTVIQNKWVFNIKPGYKNTPPRFKARLVAKGFTQEYGVDYEETFAPVLKNSALRVVFGLIASLDLETVLLDVKTAFLYGELEEEIYMSQPEGFLVPGRELEVCRLIKSLYGLKQAPRAWNKRFNDFLVTFGLVRSTADPCIYYHHQKEEFTILAIFVDDGLICSNKIGNLRRIIEHLEEQFQIRTMDADRFLGIEFSRNRKKKELTAAQPLLTLALLKKFRMENCLPKPIPADPHTHLSSEMSPKSEKEKAAKEKIPYREAVGSLLYLAMTTRPDIAFAVGQVSQYCQNPGNGHWNAVKRIFSYLAGTPYHGLCFRNSNNQAVIGYSDADFARDQDTRRSTTGYIFFYHGGPVVWASRRQRCTSLSTTEAEYVAGCESSKEAVWIDHLLKEIGQDKLLPIPLLCDNQSAIRLAKNPEFHQRTKHVQIKYHFIREQLKSGIIDLQYVGTENQLADILTKPLETNQFQNLRDQMGIIDVRESSA